MISKNIEIIKEYVIDKKHDTIIFTVRTKLYDDNVQYWLDLVEIAKKDFPQLTLDRVKSVMYGGDCYRRTKGIEFSLNVLATIKIPEGYVNGFSLTDIL